MKTPNKGFEFKDHFLTARYLAPSDEYFETGEVYRLQYERHDDRIIIQDALGSSVTYEDLRAFRYDWDMENIPERYKAYNPRFEG